MKKVTWQRIGAAALAVLVWQAASMAVGSALLLPSPAAVLVRLAALLPDGGFWRAVWFSFCRIAGGFGAALVLGTALAFAAGRWPVVDVLLRPYVLVIKSVPVASFIILALIWMRASSLPLFISFLMVFPILYTNVLAGIRSADRELLEMARVFRVPWLRQARCILLPAAEPFLLAGSAAALGMSWKAGVAAEVIGVVGGSIGEKLYEAKIYLQTGDLLAWTAVIVALSALFERAVLALLRQYGLPVDCAYPVEQMLGTILHDKKASGGSINLIVPTAVGSCEIRKTPASEISDWLRAGGAK